MSDHERLSTLQSYVWTLELLGEALVQHDEVLECEHNPQLSFRNTAGDSPGDPHHQPVGQRAIRQAGGDERRECF